MIDFIIGCRSCGHPVSPSSDNLCSDCRISLNEQQTHYDRVSNETVYDYRDEQPPIHGRYDLLDELWKDFRVPSSHMMRAGKSTRNIR